MLEDRIKKLKQVIDHANLLEMSGTVKKVVGMTIESKGPMVKMGDICKIFPHSGGEEVLAEVVGFKDENVVLMPFGNVSGIGAGNKVVATGTEYKVAVGEGLRGRVLDALGRPRCV